MPTGRRLTVLKASGGFGKTVLLSECCRQLRANGVPVAYLSLDERDTPDMLDACIALACASVGLDLRHGPESTELMEQPAHRTALVASRIQSLDRPFVIALDEIELLTQPACAAIVEFLLRRGPSNLHLALSGRQLPDSLNVAALVLDGSAELLEAEDLRFERAEVAAFFNHRLSRRALTREAEQSAGWPFALRVSSNGTPPGVEASGSSNHVAGNWIESRLLARLEPDERNLVLDLGLFDWLDETILAEVLRLSDAMQHVRSLAVLDGLLEPVESAGSLNWRLHPLLRRHCAVRRFREDAERFRTIHRRIATALARRGETIAGMRHAIEGGDPSLAGELFERAGGVRIWLRDGVAQLREADDLLADDVVAKSPRLMLARCTALSLSGQHHESRLLYNECSALMLGSPKGGAGIECQVDDCVARGAMHLYGGESVGSAGMQALLNDSMALCRLPMLAPPIRGILTYAPCMLHFLKGEFEAALDRLSAVRTLLPESRYLAFYGEIMHGQTCLVQAQAQAARSHFDNARRIVRQHLPLDPVALMASEVTRRELLLELNPESGAEPPGIRRALTEQGVPFSFFATALNLFAQIRLLNGDVDQLASATGEMLIRVGAAGRPAFAKMLATVHTSALVAAGRIDEAERAWRREALPMATASCVDLKSQGWREFEGICEARARLLIAMGLYGEGRELLREFYLAAEKRSWRRMQFRALALAAKLELRAGDHEAGLRHLTAYLRLFDEAPYALPLVRERSACSEPLSRIAAAADDAPHKQNAALLLASMRRAGERSALSLSDRERQVLRELAKGSVKAVANSIGLSVHGVRYHLRRLFEKFGVSNRAALLRRARELGLAPDDA